MPTPAHKPLRSKTRTTGHTRKNASPPRRKRPRRATVVDLSDSDSDSGGSGTDKIDAIDAPETTDADAEEWYAIKDIIGERVEKRNRRLYLVDWADHPETGASYPPSWIPARDASRDAVKAWKKLCLERKNAANTKQSEKNENEQNEQNDKNAENVESVERVDTDPVTIDHTEPVQSVEQEPTRTPEPKPASHKRRHSLSSLSDSLSDSPSSKKQKGLRQVPNPAPPAPPSEAFSRGVSTESPDVEPEPQRQPQQPEPESDIDSILESPSETGFDTASEAESEVAPKAASSLYPVEIGIVISQNFDPDDYTRFSQLPSQPQPQPQPLVSSQTIPDSQADTTNPSTLESQAPLGVPSIPSHQPEVASDHSTALFQTQPDTALGLLSSPQSHSAALVTPAAPQHHSPSVISDSSHPLARTAPTAPAEPIIPITPRVPPLLRAFSHSTQSDNEDENPVHPSTSAQPQTPPALPDAHPLRSMEAEDDDLDPVLVLRKAYYDALGPGGLTRIEPPSRSIQQYLTDSPTSLSAAPQLLPPVSEPPEPPEPPTPAAVDTSLLVTAVLMENESEHATAAPSALSLAPALSVSPDPPTDRSEQTEGLESLASTSTEQPRHLSPSPSEDDDYPHEYTVTLPLASNARQRYIDVVMDKESQKTIQAFSHFFTHDTQAQPSSECVSQVDGLLQKLLDLADLPSFHNSLPTLSAGAMMKHAANTNSKFTFLHELLGPLRALDKKVLILARGGHALDYLEALVRELGIPLQRVGQEAEVDGSTHTLSVVLAETTVSVARLPTDVDFVIGFDHTVRTSSLLSRYLSGATSQRGRGRRPVVLLLVASHSLEHIDLRLPVQTLSAEERKNALLLCTLECLPYLQDFGYEEQPKPHEAAVAFGKVFGNPHVDIAWKPVTLPDAVFDIYISSSQSPHPLLTQEEAIAQENIRGGAQFGGLGQNQSRKRALTDDKGMDEDAQKRVRVEPAPPIVPVVEVALSDALRKALRGPLVTEGPTVTISLAQLEALAARTIALEDQLLAQTEEEKLLLERLTMFDCHAKDLTESLTQCEEKLQTALKDRGNYEVQRDQANKDATSTRERLTAKEAALAEATAQVTSLTARLTEATELMRGSTVPTVARLGEAEAAVTAAEQQMVLVTRRAANAETDLSHARRAYQDASNAAAELSNENRKLTSRVREAERLASDNLHHIHEMNARSESAMSLRRWNEQLVAMRERERDLQWTREELRVLKNGRRETRAQSVPRSPRLGVMSPRTAGRATGSVGPHSSSSASRGNSPIVDGNSNGNGNGNGYGNEAPMPGLTYLQQSGGGGRWGHLRD